MGKDCGRRVSVASGLGEKELDHVKPGMAAMRYELFNKMALRTDVPDHSLVTGDIGIIVQYHPPRANQEPGYTLEVFNAVGDTVAVVTLPESQLAPLSQDEVFHVRRQVRR